MTSPNFIIAGERRSGSTSLYDILKKHTDVGMLQKSDFDYFIEPELFSLEAVPIDAKLKNWAATHSLEEFQEIFSSCKGVVGQKNADILWWSDSHKRIAEMLPTTKFIFVLRNPVQRAYSQYCNEVSKGRETSSFKKAIEREESGVTTDWQKLHLAYKERGCYWKSLSNFFTQIPEERVLIVVLEELTKEPAKIMSQLCAFLNIDTEKGLAINIVHSNKERLLKRKEYTKEKGVSLFFNIWDRLTEAIIVRAYNDKYRRNKARNKLRGFYYEEKRKKVTIDPVLEKELQAFYKPHNQKLQELFGVNIRYWS